MTEEDEVSNASASGMAFVACAFSGFVMGVALTSAYFIFID